ncbi:MAG: hemerythrin domain-containing protein [Deltaproteobacteria bacterium]|nr:hemerythrin domain-containing protein [Deltaproteobacteria bacterium]
MKLIDELRAEHDIIDPMAGALRTYVARRVRGQADAADAPRFLAFFRLYADAFHHAREEGVLLPALARDLDVPSETGPIAAVLGDHVRMRATFAQLAALLGSELDAASGARLEQLATEYTRALWLHIDSENSVLFLESEHRLPRAGTHELPTRAPTDAEAAARDDATALLLRYPPLVDDGIIRGEGCPICPNFGVHCDGVERAWWNENEWDEFPDRVG